MKWRRRWPLLPLVPLYGAAQALDSLSHARGWRRRERLAWPVVSVGNLSVGGAGKTPFVIALARLLTERGWSVDVLTRGYGRASDQVERIAMEGVEGPAARYGDEPWLIAQAAQVPVIVGRSRAAAGRLAEQSSMDANALRRVHLLDDGMQHRRLERDVEIVLLHRTDFHTTLLPAGRLREPLAALERADFVVLRDGDIDLEDRARRWMRAGAQIWRIERRLVLPTVPGDVIAFSAIAHPEEFAADLQQLHVPVVATQAWRDHHPFTSRDIDLLARLARQHRARCFLTTEKDIVRLTQAQRTQLERMAPVLAVRLRVQIVDADDAVAALEERLLRLKSRRAVL